MDPLECPRCGAAMTVVSFINPWQRDVIDRILEHCGLSSRAPPVESRAPPPDRKEVIEPTGGFESEFEELIYNGMTDANYRTVLRCQVGEYVLDVVVEGAGGKRVAVLCDGDRHQPEEELPEVMERQLTLERLGWTFIRVRASEFFRNPEAGLKKLFKRLKQVGIEPIGPRTAEETADTNRGEVLKQKVLKRAEQIRRAWKNIPDAPAAPSKPTPDADAEEDAGAEQDEETREAA